MKEDEYFKHFPQASKSSLKLNAHLIAPSKPPTPRQYAIAPFEPPPAPPKPEIANVSGENRQGILDWLDDVDQSVIDRRIINYSVNVKPIGAPRTVRSDTWKPRKCIIQYHAFRDKLRASIGRIDVPDGLFVKAFVPVPEGQTLKQLRLRCSNPHRQKPDVDNIWKGVADALFGQDCEIWLMGLSKFWCRPGEERLDIKMIYYFKK